VSASLLLDAFIFIILVQGAAGMNVVKTFNQTQTAMT
jgi:hypothetical protein